MDRHGPTSAPTYGAEMNAFSVGSDLAGGGLGHVEPAADWSSLSLAELADLNGGAREQVDSTTGVEQVVYLSMYCLGLVELIDRVDPTLTEQRARFKGLEAVLNRLGFAALQGVELRWVLDRTTAIVDAVADGRLDDATRLGSDARYSEACLRAFAQGSGCFGVAAVGLADIHRRWAGRAFPPRVLAYFVETVLEPTRRPIDDARPPPGHLVATRPAAAHAPPECLVHLGMAARARHEHTSRFRFVPEVAAA